METPGGTGKVPEIVISNTNPPNPQLNGVAGNSKPPEAKVVTVDKKDEKKDKEKDKKGKSYCYKLVGQKR